MPNITGIFRGGLSCNGTLQSGAFVADQGYGDSKSFGAAEFLEFLEAGFSFDASRCNSAYVNNGEVHPDNYTVRLWKRVS